MRHANDSATHKCETSGVRLTHTTTRSFELSNLERLTHSVNQKINKHKNKLLVAIVVGALTAPIGANSAVAAPYSIDHLKLYAHSRILDYKEFQCFNKIITKESRWNYQARNGSHYGLGQMRSKHYGNLDPYRQIDATLAYVTKRYNSNCKALAFHNQRNYF